MPVIAGGMTSVSVSRRAQDAKPALVAVEQQGQRHAEHDLDGQHHRRNT